MNKRLIVALDVDTLKEAEQLVDKLRTYVGIFKIGNQLFTACGPEAIKMMRKKRVKIFLDLKYHDIPNTVAKAVKVASKMGIFMINLHASGGREMMKAAKSAKAGRKKPIILAVTVLTSLDTKNLKDIGIRRPPSKQVRELALLAKRSGLDGVVCSARETEYVRKVCGDKFIIVTPGIRPLSGRIGDQKRVATAQYAFGQGSDYIVIGRPITASKDPASAVKVILKEC